MKYKIMVFLMIISAGIAIPLGFGLPVAQAQQTMDITKATEGKASGGEKVGTVTITPAEHTLTIIGNMTTAPAQGKVFEGWLVDAGGSEYQLSLGEFQNDGTLRYHETLVNPYTYSQFVVTEEPSEDADPNAAAAFAGTDLQAPFGS